MIHRIYFVLLLLAFPFIAKAQLGKELILNGGFEDYTILTPPDLGEDDEEDKPQRDLTNFDPYLKPNFWYFNSSLFPARIQEAHSGTYAVKLYTNGGSFFSRDNDFNPYHIDVEAGGEYRLEYWYKGKTKNPNIIVTVDWYKDKKSIKKDTRDKDKAKSFTNEWQKKTFTFKAPSGVNKAGVGIYIENDAETAASDGYILIDDISFVQTKKGTSAITLEAPANVVARPEQREMVLSWNSVAIDNVSYQILVNGETVATTNQTSYTVEGLEPNKSYKISVRTIKGEETSEPSALVTQQTQPMNMRVEDEGRIPYLYTVRENGTCPRTLRLFYHDLANPNAQMVYKIDGNVITPTNATITFANKGQHLLQIEIVETPERKWEIEYKLNVD